MGQKATFSKPFLELRDLIALLRARGLDVDVPDADAEEYLSTVNYYRFTGYAVAFQADREHFKKDARFTDIQAIYAYDRGLRELVFSAAPRGSGTNDTVKRYSRGGFVTVVPPVRRLRVRLQDG